MEDLVFSLKKMEKKEKTKKVKDAILDFIQVLSIIQLLISVIGGSGITIIVVVLLIPEISLLWSIILGILLILTIAIFMVLANILILKKREIVQTRDIEEHRRKDKERPATEPLKEEFEKFLVYWKENKELIFEDVSYIRKIPWMEIESIGKESKNMIEDNKNVLGANTENDAIKIADAIIELSKLIRRIENLRLSDEYYTERKKRAFDEGDKIVKGIGAFIEKM